MHPLDPLNGSKTRLIDVHAEAFALDVIGVASGRIIVIDKLSTAFDADVILLTFFLAVLTDMSRSTLGTLHGRLPLIHTLIMQRQQLWAEGKLAVTTTARFQQLVACGIGGSTLYKYKSLWHPHLWKTPQTPQASNEGAVSAMAPPATTAHAPSLLSGKDRNASGSEPLSTAERPDPAAAVRNPADQSTWQQAYAQLKQRQLHRKTASPLQLVPPTAQSRLGEPRLVEKMADYLRSRDPILMKEGLAWLVQQDE